MALPYPPLQMEIATPRLKLLGATDDRLERLIPTVREGVVQGDEVPFDDPMSLYETSPTREWRWLQAASPTSSRSPRNRVLPLLELAR